MKFSEILLIFTLFYGFKLKDILLQKLDAIMEYCKSIKGTVCDNLIILKFHYLGSDKFLTDLIKDHYFIK